MRCYRAYQLNDHRPGNLWRLWCRWYHWMHQWDSNKFGERRKCICCGRQERTGAISGAPGQTERRQWYGEFD